ncbi:MAG: hypothetical protein RLZZ459_1373 [Cyanobacteriota bacterium]|jgi:hypothetical protein
MVWSNPGPADFEEFAGERLVDLIAEEVCQGTELPLVLHLLVRDCPGMIRSQRKVLGRLAAQETTRYNAGLFSLYVSELGGQELLGRLPIPRYRALTLAGAGQLVVVQAGIANGDLNAR